LTYLSSGREGAAAAAISSAEERIRQQAALLGERLREISSDEDSPVVHGGLVPTAAPTAVPNVNTVNLVHWATPSGHRDVFSGSGTIHQLSCAANTTNGNLTTCSPNTAGTYTPTNLPGTVHRRRRLTGTPVILRVHDAQSPGLDRAQDFLRRLKAGLKNAFQTEVSEHCSNNQYSGGNVTDIGILPVGGTAEGGWDGSDTMDWFLPGLKLSAGSAYGDDENSYNTDTGSMIKIFKFTLGCCYTSMVAIKMTEIIPGTVGAKDVIAGWSVVSTQTSYGGMTLNWVTHDSCGILDGTTTKMKQTQIEDAFAKVVASFRFCVAKEIFNSDDACSPKYNASP